MTVYFTVGLPASGKTTWALQRIAESGGVYVNRDNLRAALAFPNPGSPVQENLVTDLQRVAVERTVLKGIDAYVADTNLNPRFLAMWQGWMRDRNITDVKYVVFRTPLDVCLIRDSKRSQAVGPNVINGMHDKFVKTGAMLTALGDGKSVIEIWPGGIVHTGLTEV